MPKMFFVSSLIFLLTIYSLPYAFLLENYSLFFIYMEGIVEKDLEGNIKSQTKIIFDENKNHWGGIIYNEKYYVFEKKYQIVSYDFQTGTKDIVLDVERGIEDNLIPSKILYISDDKLYFSAAKSDSSIHGIFKFYFFVVNLTTNQISQLPIYDEGDGRLCLYQNKIYYARNDGVICVYDGEKIESTEINGKYPSISPDGLKIAYVTSSSLFEKVKIHFIKDNSTEEVIKFLGKRTVNPRIRWSSDSRLIAVEKRSDFSPQPLYVIDIEEKKTLYKYKKNKAVNWFFNNH